MLTNMYGKRKLGLKIGLLHYNIFVKFSFNLKSGYHHIDIFPDHCKYLSFAWDFGQGKLYFSFLVLPFGLSSAPYIFTKCIRSSAWRDMGFSIVILS